MTKRRREEFAISAKRELLEKVIAETESGNIGWKYAFAKEASDYYAEWRGRILTIRSLRDEGPRLRVFAQADQALITYDPARAAMRFPREDKALIYCWEGELSELNRRLCHCIATYLEPEECKKDKGSARGGERWREAAEKYWTRELREIKKILGE